MGKVITFTECGLEIDKNFLEAPKCECGCGAKASLVLKTNEELVDFCGTMCGKNECNQCAVFAINQDSSVIGAIKQDGEICIIASSIPLNDYKEIGRLAKDLNLHCYGLIKWVDDGLYNVIEE